MTETHSTPADKIDTQRIIALWAFSEAAFGGILHALKIPFTGLFLGSAAVLFMTLIASANKNRSSILHATLLVILVKAAINPYSPLTVYLAISVEGIAGYLFFRFIRYEKLAALTLGFFALTFSALQKVLVLTLIFGNDLWRSINNLADSVFQQIGLMEKSDSLNFSLGIISVYTGLHVCVGILTGILSIKIRNWILENELPAADEILPGNKNEEFILKKNKSGKKFWWKRISGILIISFLLAATVYSYFYPNLSKVPFYDIIIMIVRSVVITLTWFFLIAPVVLKLLRKFLNKKKNRNLEEIDRITSQFPYFRKILNYSWKSSSSMKGYKRVFKFLSSSFLLIISAKPSTR